MPASAVPRDEISGRAQQIRDEIEARVHAAINLLELSPQASA